jgi:hypothetical protein
VATTDDNFQPYQKVNPKALQEIFDFYSRQHIPWNATFQNMLDGYTSMNNGEFVMFCRDFSINLHKDKLLGAFNKVSEVHKPIKEGQFLKVLEKLSVEINQSNVEIVDKRLKVVAQLDIQT